LVEHGLGRSPEDFEERLGLQRGFFGRLRDEDDWSFVIKGHALLEAALARVLANELHRPELLEVFARLDMADSDFGKLKFAAVLKVVSPENRAFIKKFGEIRNKFVHNVAHVGLTLREYFARQDKQQLDSSDVALDRILDTESKQKLKAQGVRLLLSDPNRLLVSSLGLVLADLAIQLQVSEGTAALRKQADDLMLKVFMQAQLHDSTVVDDVVAAELHDRARPDTSESEE
jgi:hypothetical protein